jgi:hypothetical protein
VPLRVECWAFGSPPVFAPLSAVPAACAETLRVFAHKHDVVPRLSLGSASRLLLRVAAIDRQPWPMQRRVALALRQQRGGGGGGTLRPPRPPPWTRRCGGSTSGVASPGSASTSPGRCTGCTAARCVPPD